MCGPSRIPHLMLSVLLGLTAAGAGVRAARANPNSSDVHRELSDARDGENARAWSASEPQMEEAIDELLAIARTDRLELRLAATEVLGEIGGDRATAALAAILWENQAEVRVRAARVLGLLGTPAAMQALSAALNTERDVIVRSELEYAIETGMPLEPSPIPESLVALETGGEPPDPP